MNKCILFGLALNVLVVRGENWKDPASGILWRFAIEKDEAIVTHAEPCEGSLVVPDSLGGCRVVGVYNQAFKNSRNLTSVKILPGVNNIGREAFSGCSHLSSISIPPSVTNIANGAFAGCEELGNGVVIVDGCVLTVNGSCPSVVNLPPGTRLIAGGAFKNHTELASVVIPEGVMYVGDYAFYGCAGLVSVAIPSSVGELGDAVFSGCSGLCDENGFTIVRGIMYGYYGKDRAISIPSGVIRIGSSACAECVSLTSVCVPLSVKRIGGSAFAGCYNLTELTISEGLEEVGTEAFVACSRLQTVKIPNGVKKNRRLCVCILRRSFFACYPR